MFSRGYQPRATQKTAPDEIDIPVIVGGVTVNPGDIVVADDDGVVIVPAAAEAEVERNVLEVMRREANVRSRIEAGESTLDIFQMNF